MRAVASALLVALVLLLVPAALAGTDYTIQIHNQSSLPVDVVVYQRNPNSREAAEKIQQHVDPDDFFVSDEVKRDSCVLVRVAHDKGDPDARCEDNATPVMLRCDVSPRYSCTHHAGEVKDLVVNVLHPR
jgi:hypothetical protein